MDASEKIEYWHALGAVRVEVDGDHVHVEFAGQEREPAGAWLFAGARERQFWPEE